MKSRSKELLDRDVAAIEIYNKPDFLYREEAFAVLAINGWELLLKAKWLSDHNNKISTLYVMEPRTKKDGTKSKKLQIRETLNNEDDAGKTAGIGRFKVEMEGLKLEWTDLCAVRMENRF